MSESHRSIPDVLADAYGNARFLEKEFAPLKMSFDDTAGPEGTLVDATELFTILQQIPADAWQALPDGLGHAWTLLSKSQKQYWSEIISIRFALGEALDWTDLTRYEGASTDAEDSASLAPLPNGATNFWTTFPMHIEGSLALARAEGVDSISRGAMAQSLRRSSTSSLVGTRGEGKLVSMGNWEIQYQQWKRYMLTHLVAHPDAREELAQEHIARFLQLRRCFTRVSAVVAESREWLIDALALSGFRLDTTIPDYYKKAEGDSEAAMLLSMERSVEVA